MHKLSKILLEIVSIGWIVFVTIAIVMILNSCQNKSMASEIDCMYANQVENIDEID